MARDTRDEALDTIQENAGFLSTHLTSRGLLVLTNHRRHWRGIETALVFWTRDNERLARMKQLEPAVGATTLWSVGFVRAIT